MDQRIIAEKIFLAGIESVMPSYLIPGVMSLLEGTLCVSELRFKLDAVDKIYVIGAGKASGFYGKGD